MQLNISNSSGHSKVKLLLSLDNITYLFIFIVFIVKVEFSILLVLGVPHSG